MRGINRVTLMGNLGRDPQLKDLPSGDKIASFPLATTEIWKNKSGEKEEATEWHNVVMWKAIAESVEKSELRKSDTIYLEGRLKTRKFTDKEGNEKKVTEVVADMFTIIRRYKAAVEAS